MTLNQTPSLRGDRHSPPPGASLSLRDSHFHLPNTTSFPFPVSNTDMNLSYVLVDLSPNFSTSQSLRHCLFELLLTILRFQLQTKPVSFNFHARAAYT
jgi:hypothetical protein